MGPIVQLWANVIAQPFDYRKYNDWNRWRSIDTHFQNGAVTVSVTFSPVKAANILVMHDSEQIGFQLPFIKDWKLLMLSLHSFSEWGRDRVALSFAYNGWHYVVYA